MKKMLGCLVAALFLLTTPVEAFSVHRAVAKGSAKVVKVAAKGVAKAVVGVAKGVVVVVKHL